MTQVVILAGGFGSRLSEETDVRPKPMIEIGRHPILWHLMHLYAHHGFEDFVVACGYKGETIKAYFHDFFVKNSDYVVDLRTGREEILRADTPPWKVAVVDTGLETQTGGRLRRLEAWVQGERFMVTYGDGLADVDLRALLAFHRAHGRLATVTAVRPPARFGALALDGDRVAEFSEKPQGGEGWINGGFFVFERAAFSYFGGDDTPLERAPLEGLAKDGQLMAFRHAGFWHPMDTLRDKRLLERLWSEGRAPWRVWP